MKTIQLISHVGTDGVLNIQLPQELQNQELEVLVVVQPVKKTQENGWSPDFFERTYGSTAQDPIERPPQGEFKIMESL